MSNGQSDQYRFEHRVPEGDDRHRLVCSDCGWIHYVNPKIVVGAVCTWEDKFLMCERAIDPRKGFWTYPAGYMEENETPEEGAAREAWEEARADIEIDALLGIYSIPRISQVQMIYRATLRSPNVEPGPESTSVRLVRWEELPWEDLAFPSVVWGLRHFVEAKGRTDFAPFPAIRDEMWRRFASRHE